MAWAAEVVVSGVGVVVVVVVLLLLLLVLPLLPLLLLLLLLPEELESLLELVVDSVVTLVVAALLDELWVDPGRVIASAKAPAIPETPTAEVTAFTRFLFRRRARSG